MATWAPNTLRFVGRRGCQPEACPLPPRPWDPRVLRLPVAGMGRVIKAPRDRGQGRGRYRPLDALWPGGSRGARAAGPLPALWPRGGDANPDPSKGRPPAAVIPGL